MRFESFHVGKNLESRASTFCVSVLMARLLFKWVGGNSLFFI